MFEEEKSEKTNICRNFVRFMEAVSYQPVSQATFFPPPSTSPLFTFQHARFSFRPKVFQTTEKLRWKIFSILLILLFTAKLFTADLGEVTFFAARFYICLRSFSIGEKKEKKRKERKGSLKFPRRPIFPVFFFFFTIIKNGYTICFISIPFLPSSYLFFSSSSSLYTFCCKHEVSFPAITL